MIKKGDTLIEVTLAIGIFSMVAVSVVAVMGNGTAGAETALETTLTREEIDAQADALRFIHSSFLSDQNHEDDRYAKLWEAITKNALDLSEIGGDIVTYSPTTCDELYSEGENGAKSPLFTQKAFVVNTDYLGAYSTAEELTENLVEDTIVSYSKSSDKFGIAKTYPHLIYQGEGGALEDNSALTESYSNFARAEGIYVIAVKDTGTELAGDKSFEEKSAFYDFYIRTCWYGIGDDFPSTISTVIRLYNPDAIVARKIEPEPEPETLYMQGNSDIFSSKMPNEGDSAIFTDSRDNKTYKITKINGRYWMTQNLRFTGTELDPLTSNVGVATTVSYGDLTSGDSYDQARIHEGKDSNGDPTVWYNFAAASAMTITGGSNESDAVYDICPKGWRLPTEDEFAAIRSNKGAFNPVGGGRYQQGILLVPDFGHWWSSTKVGGNGRYQLYGNSIRGLSVDYNGSRDRGHYIRCIMKEQETPTPAPITHNLEIIDDNADYDMDLALAAMYVREGSPTGAIKDCPGGGGHFVCYDLVEGNDYYLYPTLNPDYRFDFWLEPRSVPGARVGDGRTENTYYRVGSDHGQLYIFAGK